MAGPTVKFRLVVEDKVSSTLNKVRDQFDRIGGPGSGASLFGNVGAKAVAKGFALIDSAATAVIGVLGDSVTAAIAEEKSVAGLGAALRANVKNWDGNTAAMEKVLQSRMRLGHSDDEQRESLKLLVGATHDVNKALALQRVAMDLAAFKGISLADASAALVKVEGGQFRILKSLGIQLPKNATATEALAAVEKVAAGSAEALANTSGGKMLASQIRVGEVMERIGEKILPAVVVALEFMAGVIEAIAGPITDFAEDVQRQFEQIAAGGRAVHDFFADLVGPVSDARDSLEDWAGTASKVSTDVGRSVNLMAGDVGGASKVTVTAFTAISDGAEATRVKTVATLKRIPGEVASGILDGRESVRNAMAQLKLAMEHPMSGSEERAWLLGQAYGANVAKGLRSKDPAVRAQAEHVRETALAVLAAGTARAFEDAKNTGQAFANGLRKMRIVVKNGAIYMVDGAREVLRAFSPPGPASPLHDIDKWGERTGQAYVDGLAKTISAKPVAEALRMKARPGEGHTVSANRMAAFGGGTGGMNFNYAPQFSTASPAEAQAFAAKIGPEIERWRRRQ